MIYIYTNDNYGLERNQDFLYMSDGLLEVQDASLNFVSDIKLCLSTSAIDIMIAGDRLSL